MLEVGQIVNSSGGLDFAWNRAHFGEILDMHCLVPSNYCSVGLAITGAWCVVSSPLVLGLALDSPVLPAVLPIITNTLAISINQQWAGHPGMLLKSTRPPDAPTEAVDGFLTVRTDAYTPPIAMFSYRATMIFEYII